MRARDLQTPVPMVTRETTAEEAARLISQSGTTGLVIADASGAPVATISALDVLRLMLPGYVLDDLSLANVFDEADVADVWEDLEKRTIGELVDDDGVPVHDMLVVEADATVIEVAARMADAETSIARVDDAAAEAPGFVTLGAVMAEVLRSREPRSAPGDDGPA